MIKMIFLLFFLALSTLVFFKAPSHILWYVSILVTEFSWVFMLLVLAVLFWQTGDQRFALPAAIIGMMAILIFLVPYAQAWQISGNVEKEFGAIFKKGKTNRGRSLSARCSCLQASTAVKFPSALSPTTRKQS
jgi:Na+/proline symporter